MKPLFTLLSLITLSAGAQTASDFTIDDIDGNSRNLFTELDNGNVVVLKFFTNWCSVCNNTADEVVAIYNSYYSNGDPVVFWALDRDQNETNADATTYRDNNNIPFPVVGEAYAVAQQFGVVYQPEYYIIRPDRSYVMKVGYGAMETAVDEALAGLTGIDDDFENEHALLITSNSITWLESPSQEADLLLFDASGRKVLDKTIHGGERTEFNLPSGVYVYRLTSEAGAAATGKLGVAH